VTDDRYAERPDRPAWAAIPTMPWSRVQPAERRDTGTSPSVQGQAGARPEIQVEYEYTAEGGQHGLAGEVETEEPTERPFGETPAEAGTDVPADPEQALASMRIQYDPVTLYEQPENVYELYRIRDSLTSKIDGAADNPSRARLLGLRAVVSRMLGEIAAALSDAKMALVHAEATGQLRRVAVAQARLANVLVRAGQLDEADRLFTEANSVELPERLRATIHHHAGRCAFEQNRYIEACQHFEKALELRRDGDPELVAATEVALDALFNRGAERGWRP
jgi:tetratricopeptide (TPR) repeat protein